MAPSYGELAFVFRMASRPALKPIKPPVQWVLGLNLLDREADH
jgi:hypothetical protein